LNKSIHIIGSGLAGLSCAINLSKKHGRNVILYEASSLYGGRCRSYKEKNFNCILDNGNHLIIKAYKNTFNYLKKIKSQKELIANNETFYPFVDIKNSSLIIFIRNCTDLMCSNCPAVNNSQINPLSNISPIDALFFNSR